MPTSSHYLLRPISFLFLNIPPFFKLKKNLLNIHDWKFKLAQLLHIILFLFINLDD